MIGEPLPLQPQLDGYILD